MTKLTIALTNDEHKILFDIADRDLRLPEQVFRWLIRQEAARRGLTVEAQPTARNNKCDVSASHSPTVAFAE